MKQSTIVLFLFLLILSSSQAQRGWRAFDQFGWVIQIYQSADDSLWVIGVDGTWQLDGQGWQQIDQVSAFVFEDSAGTLWFAGSNSEGLWRYNTDGWHQETQVTGIVNSIYQEPNGTLWVGGLDVVWRYDQNGWQQLTGFAGLVWQIHRDLDGTLWLGTENTDIPWWVPMKPPEADGALWRYDDDGWQQQTQVTGLVWQIHRSSDGILWVFEQNGLWRYDTDSFQPGPEVAGGLGSFYQDKDGILWAGSSAGLWRYGTDGWQHVPQVIGGIGSLRAFYEDKDGTLWAGGKNGPWRRTKGGWESYSAGTGEIWTLSTDKDNTLWVGGPGGFWHYDSSGWQPISQVTGMVSTIYEDMDGILWLGGWNTVQRYDDVNGWQQQTLNSGFIEIIYKDKNDTLWLGGGNGLWRYQADGWQQQPKVAKNVRTIYEDQAGILWTSSENGLWRYEKDDWQQQQINSSIFRIYQDRDGTLWASGENGLWRYRADGWEQQNQIIGWISTVYQDRDGTLWACGEKGVWRYQADGWQLHSENTDEIWDIYEDQDGTLWASGEKGIWRYQVNGWQLKIQINSWITFEHEDQFGNLWLGGEDGVWRKSGTGKNEVWFHFDRLNYNKQLGLPSSHVWDIHPRPDGSLWFGSTSGLAVYRPDSHSPNVEILSVDGQPHSLLPPNYITGYSALAFKWAADDMETLTEYISYQYKIDDEKWLKTPIQQVNTPVLSDGQHTFFLRAVDYDGNPSRIVTFDFTVDTVRPSVLIAKPVPNQVVGNSVEILGSVLDNDLSQFEVEYRSLVTDVFQPIASGDKPQTSSILADWKTQSLPDGEYQLRVTATDQLGHSKQYQVDITVDNTPPVILLQTPAAGQKLSGNLNITAQVSDLHLQQYRLKYTQDLPLTSKSQWESIPTSLEFLSANPTQISQTWNSADIFGPTLVRLLVLDQAGNRQTAQALIDLNNLTAKPRVQITYPTAEAVLSGLVRIQGTASDPTLTSYTIEVESQPKPTSWTTITSQGTVVNFGELGAWDTTAVSDGDYRLRLSGLDSNGYQSQILLSVQVDNTPPTAVIQRPEQMVNERWIASGTIAIRGMASDQNLKSYRLEYGSGLNSNVWQAIAGVSQDSVEDVVLQEWDTTRLAGGEYTLRLTVTDQAGLSSESRLKLILDNQQAGAELMAPSQNQYVNSQVAIIGTASDKNFKGYRLELGDGKDPASWQVLTQSPTIRQSEVLYNWDTTGLDGQYTLKLVVEDFTNGQVVVKRQVMVDNTLPQAQITLPEAGAIVSGNLQIVGTANDAHFNSYLLERGSGINPAAGDWQPIEGVSITGVNKDALRRFATTTVADGIYSLRLKVEDKVGQISTARRTITIDNNPPQVMLQSPTQNQYVSGQVAITGTANDQNFKGYRLELGVGRNPDHWQVLTQSSTIRQAEGLYNWDTTGLEGQYTLGLVVEDFTNDQVVVKRQVMVDNTPPQAQITLPEAEAIVSGNLQIVGTASDDYFDSYLLQQAEGANPAAGDWQPIEGVSVSAVNQGTLRQFATRTLADGVYSLRLEVTDKVGQISTDRRTITIDNTPPQVTLQSPTQNQVISQTVEIIGIVSDANLEQVQVFFRQSGNWRSLVTVQGATVGNRLAKLDTVSLKDGEYHLKLVATDRSGQPPTELARSVIVDNTPPQAEISQPRNNDQVGQVLMLFGTASDANFKSYRVEFGEGASPTIWAPASTRDFQTSVEQGELLQWLPGKRSGVYSLRLTVEDQVKQQGQAQVRISITSLTEKVRGGDVSSADGGVVLYLPPNSLQKDTIVTVNRIPSSAISWPRGSSWQPLDLVYQLEADPLQLAAIKPATLTISYGGASLTPGQQPIIFRQVDDSQQWQLIGGVVNTSQQTVSTAIHQLGRYGVMEIAPVRADSSAQLLKESLTCQPRVFSPIGHRAPNTETTISFQLDKSAQVSIKVYNVAGGLVNWLTEEQTFSEGKVALPWDGRDHHGQVVPTGLYIVAVAVGGETQTNVVNVWNQ
ncbi:MAG: Ig-like domain-containing protein [Candidatus Poribacteria bacterium]|nr:Ig-like domain-containing protein [Candidatus Poribacteria bacterium]